MASLIESNMTSFCHKPTKITAAYQKKKEKKSNIWETKNEEDGNKKKLIKNQTKPKTGIPCEDHGGDLDAISMHTLYN